jgi:branched-chain amino acid aminotransferase
MHRFALHNDEIIETSAKVLAPGQVGLLSGWGVFSTLRVARGMPFAFERHWERMKRDAATLRVPFPADAARVRSGLLRLIGANEAREATLRMVVVRNRGGIWEGPSDRDSDLIALTTGLKDWGDGVKLTVQEQARHAASRFRGVKMLSWALNLATLEEAQRRGFDEALLLNERGEVSECTSANVFVARGGDVLTPPLESGCLPGVTREILLEAIQVEGIRIREGTIRVPDLASADEVFVTSTTRNVLPVVSIDGQPAPHRGEVRDALESAFERYVEAYTAKAS